MIMLMCRMLVRTDRVDEDRPGMAVDGAAGEQAQQGTQGEKGFHDRIPGKGCGSGRLAFVAAEASQSSQPRGAALSGFVSPAGRDAVGPDAPDMKKPAAGCGLQRVQTRSMAPGIRTAFRTSIPFRPLR
ncbi:hypothetical protein [Uliginosibacterium paludis]|uniref:hypothetical protein n=1 Tax=Uliginosibacterium paludis TaxID=1615952 RepID=UPI00338DCDB1